MHQHFRNSIKKFFFKEITLIKKIDCLINQFNKACIEGNLEVIKSLIKDFNLDINIQNNKEETGFHYAFKVYVFGC